MMRNQMAGRIGAWVGAVAGCFAAVAILGPGLLRGSAPPRATTIWDAGVWPGAAGLEAERDTWVRTPRKLDVVAERDGQEWTVAVAGDARPTMRRMRLEPIAGTADSPFLLSDKNFDFRSASRLVASVTRGATTDEQKSLALRDLLIGEGFYFHFRPPPMMDPIHRLTNAGYGFCGQHAQIFEQLAHIAGLRPAVCGHAFGYGHASNQVFYDSQWHFMDSNAEGFFRRADGVIPSYEEIRRNANLVPPGDAYGQTSFGIDGARYARALYAGKTTCVERLPASDTEYGALRFALRTGESITWEWQDADFSSDRANKLPVFGRGTVDMRPQTGDFRPVTPDVSLSPGSLALKPSADSASVRTHVGLAYPPLEVSLTAEQVSGHIEARISKDGGATWLDLPAVASSSGRQWRATVPDPDKWQSQPERHRLTGTECMVRAGRYGYVLELRLERANGQAALLSGLRLATVFRHYPPTLPFLKSGDNRVTYVDDGSENRQVRVTLEWEERTRTPGLSTEASEWGWGDTIQLSQADTGGALPTLATAADGALHAVFAAGPGGSRRIALRTYRGKSWSPETLLTPPNQDASHPVAAVDGGGTLWLAYQVGGLWQGGDVWVLSFRNGKTSEPVRMNTSDPYHVAFFPSISASQSQVIVAWEGGQIDKDADTAWGTEVGWLRTLDGEKWGEPSIVRGEPFINFGLPKVYYDGRGRLHLTGTKGPRYYRTIAPEQSSFQWMTPEWVYHSRGASLFADHGDNLWSAFDGQGSGTTNEIYVRMLPSAAQNTAIENWTKAIRISEDDKRPSIYPDFWAADPSRVAVTWMDYRNGSAEVYAKMFDRGRWSPDLLLSAGADAAARKAAETLSPNQILTSDPRGLHSGYPRIAATAGGTLWAVWEDSVDGTPRAVKARPFNQASPGAKGPITPLPQ